MSRCNYTHEALQVNDKIVPRMDCKVGVKVVDANIDLALQLLSVNTSSRDITKTAL